MLNITSNYTMYDQPKIKCRGGEFWTGAGGYESLKINFAPTGQTSNVLASQEHA